MPEYGNVRVTRESCAEDTWAWLLADYAEYKAAHADLDLPDVPERVEHRPAPAHCPTCTCEPRLEGIGWYVRVE